MKDEIKETPIAEVSIDNNNSLQRGESVAPSCEPVGGDYKSQIAELNDKYIRAVAELENSRRRAGIDADNMARNRAMSVANNFLPVMDAIDAALAIEPDNEGIKSMAAAMNAAFAKTGLIKIESVGQVLNPQFHNAISVIDIPSVDDSNTTTPAPNTILAEAQTGYMFGNIVLRPAMVIVGK
jgi:molecular chaperone GrpE